MEDSRKLLCLALLLGFIIFFQLWYGEPLYGVSLKSIPQLQKAFGPSAQSYFQFIQWIGKTEIFLIYFCVVYAFCKRHRAFSFAICIGSCIFITDYLKVSDISLIYLEHLPISEALLSLNRN